MSEQQNQLNTLAGKLTEHQRYFNELSVPDRQWVIQNPKTAIELFVEAVQNRTRETVLQEPPPPLFTFVTTTQLGPTGEKKTSKCFTGALYVHRDFDFNTWLPAKQSPTMASIVTTLASSRDWTFIQAAALVLGVSTETSVITLGNLLKERGHTMTLVQAEDMVERTERAEKTGLLTDGGTNFFFVEDEDGRISVGRVVREVRGWGTYVYSLGSRGVWGYDNRFLISNLKDTPAL